MFAMLALACLDPTTDATDTAETAADTETPPPAPEELYGVLRASGSALEVEDQSVRAYLNFGYGELPQTEARDCYHFSASTYDDDDYFYVDGGEKALTLDGAPFSGNMESWPAGQLLSAKASGALFPAFDLGAGLAVPEWVELRVEQEVSAHGEFLNVSWAPAATGWVVVRVNEQTDPEATSQDVCVISAAEGSARVFAGSKTSYWTVSFVTEVLLPLPPTQGVLVRFETGHFGVPLNE